MIPCPSDERLELLVADSLAAADRSLLEAHVEGCSRCQEALDRLTAWQRADTLPLRKKPPTAPLLAFLDTLIAETRLLAVNGPSATGAAAGKLPELPGYEVEAVLGRGGAGVVYRARQVRLGRSVALKMILGGRLADGNDRARFLTEAQAIARLQHPHIVQVFEVGEHDDLPFFSLELCEGGSLAEHLAGAPQGGRAAAELAETLARAVHYAHERGVVHRDLKPSNILLATGGLVPNADGPLLAFAGYTPKIADFGLARQRDSEVGRTQTGAILGSPSYMAPEQAQGRRSEVGVAADVYALGAILYELLTGRPPFRAESPLQTLELVVHHEPVPPRQLQPGTPRDLETICLKCLHKDPRRRYSSALALADDLRRWQKGEPIQARPVGRAERLWQWCRRRPALAGLAAALLLVTLSGLSGVLWQWGKAVHLAEDLRLERDAARRTSYRANIAAASGALRLNNLSGARAALTDAPEEYRGWEWRYFWSQLDGARTVLRGHERGVWAVAVSPDSRRIATADGGALRLWNAADGDSTGVIHSAPIDGVPPMFTPNGRWLICAAADGGLHVRDGAGEDVRVLRQEDARVRAFALSPDSGRIAALWSDHTLCVWELATGTKVASLPADFETVPYPHLAYSADGRHLAYTAPGNVVCVGDLTAQKEVAVLRGHTAGVWALAFSPDGSRLATGAIYPDNSVRLWNAATGESLHVLTGHTNQIEWLGFSSDGTRLASCSGDQTARLWDGDTGAPVAVLRGHTGKVTRLAFNPTGTRLVSASVDHTLRLWETSGGELVAVLRGHEGSVEDVAYSGDGSLLASASADGTVRLWDAELAERNGVLRGHTSFVYDVAFSPDGQSVASAAWDSTVRLWEPTSGRQTGLLPHDNSVLQSVAFDGVGKYLAAVERGLTPRAGLRVQIWDVAARRQWRTVPLPGAVSLDARAALNPTGTLLATGNRDGVVRLWDVNTGDALAELSGHTGDVRDVAFSPDGTRLASAGEDGSIRLWDVATRQLWGVLQGHTGAINRVAWSADARLLASAGADGQVCLWDVAARQQLAALRQGSIVYGVAFSPDGERLAAGCADNTIRLWDVAARDQVAELHGHTDYVHAVVFSPDGTRLASASGDGTVRVWDTIAPQTRARQK